MKRKRITAPIERRHPDGSTCAHKVTTVGKPTEAGCTGVYGYAVACSACSWTFGPSLRIVVARERLDHLDTHKDLR